MKNIGHKSSGDNSPNAGNISLDESGDFSNAKEDVRFQIAPSRETKKEKSDLKGGKLPKWVYWVWFVAIVSLGVSLASIIVSIRPHMNWSIEIVSTATTLTFVGILATFIVVSNFSQVKAIEDRFENGIKRIGERQEAFEKDVSFFDNYVDGITAYNQAVSIITENSVRERYGLSSYRQLIVALLHFTKASEYKTTGSHIQLCLDNAEKVIEAANEKEIELSNDKNFLWSVCEITKSKSSEFTDELRMKFIKIEATRIEKEKKLQK